MVLASGAATLLRHIRVILIALLRDACVNPPNVYRFSQPTGHGYKVTKILIQPIGNFCVI